MLRPVLSAKKLRRQKSGYRCRLAQFCQKFMENLIKLTRNLHHGRMTALVYKMKFAVRNKSLKFSANKWWGDCIIVTPYQQCGLFDLAKFFAKIISNRTFCKRNDLNRFQPVPHYFIYLINQLFGCRFG